MSSSTARLVGTLLFSGICLGPAPGLAEVVAPEQGTIASAYSQSRDAGLAARVRDRLKQMMPDEAIQVRTANAGLVLSGLIADPANLPRALAVAEEHAPGRVSNLMTVGHLPRIDLSLQLAEMPKDVARNLSASMGMFTPAEPGLAGALPGYIAALEAKGVLRPIAQATLAATAGRVTHLPDGSGCANLTGGGIGMDVTPTLAEDGAIEVTLRTCLPGKSARVNARTVTIRLQDGQTFAVADVLPDTLRDPGAYNRALAQEPTLGPVLSSADYRAGLTEVMILITARIDTTGPILSAGNPPLPSGAGVLLVSDPKAHGTSPGGATEAFTVSRPLLK